MDAGWDVSDGEYLSDPVTFFFRRHPRMRAELITTRTEPTLCTNAPVTGFRIAVAARTMAVKLSVIDTRMLMLIVRIIFFDSLIRCGSLPMSSFTTVMSDASMAMSLPMLPMDNLEHTAYLRYVKYDLGSGLQRGKHDLSAAGLSLLQYLYENAKPAGVDVNHPAQVEQHVRAVLHHREDLLAERRRNRRDETPVDVDLEDLLLFRYVPAHFRCPFYLINHVDHVDHVDCRCLN